MTVKINAVTVVKTNQRGVIWKPTIKYLLGNVWKMRFLLLFIFKEKQFELAYAATQWKKHKKCNQCSSFSFKGDNLRTHKMKHSG